MPRWWLVGMLIVSQRSRKACGEHGDRLNPQVFWCPVWGDGQKVTNWNRVDKQESARKAISGVMLWERALWLAEFIDKYGGVFILEHPANATSWGRPSSQHLLQKTNVGLSRFDMCMFGLCTKVKRDPILKATKFASNSVYTNRLFGGARCDGTHHHVNCQGYEGGEMRSVHAQRYPGKLCQKISELVGLVVEPVPVELVEC